MKFSQFSKLIVTVVKTSMSAGVIISDPNVKMKQSEKNAKKLCHRCHNINVVALTPTCLSMWKTCPTSDPRSLSPTLILSASSQIHQTSLLGADKCPNKFLLFFHAWSTLEMPKKFPDNLENTNKFDSIMEEADEYGAITEEWGKLWHHHWGLGLTSGFLQLVRQR